MTESGGTVDDYYSERAEEWLVRALYELRRGDDAIPSLTGALAYLRAEAGELDPADLPDEEGPDCICPADLLARGGFRGQCPVHGLPQTGRGHG